MKHVHPSRRASVLWVRPLLASVIVFALSGTSAQSRGGAAAAEPQAVGAGEASPSPSPTAFHRYYFKERRPLELDLTSVALFQSSAARPDAHALETVAPKLDAKDPEAFAIRGWSIVPMRDGARQASSVVESVRNVAQARVSDFVSPVFVGDDGGPVIVSPTILVGFEEHVDRAKAEAILARVNAGTVFDRDWANMKAAYRIRSASRDGFEVLATANALAELPEVRWAEPDMIFTGRGDLIPNDTFFSDCWGLNNTGQFSGTPDMDMDAPEAWDITTGDPAINVVIIDTGVEQDHPDINQVPGTDTTSDPSTTGDPVNNCDVHGTAVAGCVSATINNSLGVVGIAPSCKSASARTFISNFPTCDGGWSSTGSWTVDSLTFAESIGARVTNNSNFYGFTSAAIEAKYEQTRDAGMVHFASAGNFAEPISTYPASLPTVNSVAALAPSGARASFSNWGPDLFISAPGETVASTDRTGNDGYVVGDYVFVNGTSFASPYTAGVAALVLSKNPGLSAVNVETILAGTAVDLGTPGYDEDYGWGFVNAHRALLAADPVCEVNKLLASDGAANDRFGISVSISGTVAVVGANGDNGNRGSAEVFTFNGTTWALKQRLTPTDPELNAYFGASVAIQNDVIVIGAVRDDAAELLPGRAYVFRYDGTTDSWEQEQRLDGSAQGSNNYFGWSVATDAGRIIVGGPRQAALAGFADIYAYNSGTGSWDLSQALTASDSTAGDHFGYSVSIRGNTAVVGANLDDCATGDDCGSAYVYRLTGSSWIEESKLSASDAGAHDVFGSSVSVSADRAFVGAYSDDNARGTNAGSVYVFRWNGSSWVQEQKLLPGDGAADDLFGRSVSASGDMLIVGAPLADQAGSDAGCAYVFRHDSTGTQCGLPWCQNQKLLASDAAEADQFGSFVSVAGETAVVGAYLHDGQGSDSGTAYIFALGPDCNANGLADVCDISRGLSMDICPNGMPDGIPDDCQCCIAAEPIADPILNAAGATVASVNNRFLSFSAGEPGSPRAVRVKFVSLPGAFSIFNDTFAWVDLPFAVSELPGKGLTDPIGAEPTFMAARLVGTPVYADWSTFGVVHVFDERIIPSRKPPGQPLEPAVYDIQFVTDGCDANSEASFSAPLTITNARWGDVAALQSGQFRAPDGSVDVTADVLAVLAKFSNAPGAPIKARAEMVGTGGTGPQAAITGKIDISDVLAVLGAFSGGSYPFGP